MMSGDTRRSAGSAGPGGSGAGSGLIGRTIDDYEIRREIGRGGMGTVFEARQISLDRLVALKVLASRLDMDEARVTRFRREAQATAKLHHPNIVPVFAQGDHDGTYYYTMELLTGQSLHDLITELRNGDCADGSGGRTETMVLDGRTPTAGSSLEETLALDESPPPRPPTASGSTNRSKRPHSRRCTPERLADVASRIACVADALAYAHGLGVIHRDIKPHNLFLADDGRLRVTDFGLARVLEQPGMTTTGEFIGSPLYMSPEQIAGGPIHVDHRTDVYSLGATLYEWLTLQPPFPGDTREQVMFKISRLDPVPPRTLEPAIPPDLETICLKALEKDPNRRYGAASEMADDLHRFARGAGIRARRAGVLERTRKFVGRHTVVSASVCFIVVATVLVTLLIRQRSEVVAARNTQQQAATTDARLAEVEAENVRLAETLEQQQEQQATLLDALRRNPELVAQVTDLAAGAMRVGGGEDASEQPRIARALAEHHIEFARLALISSPREPPPDSGESAYRAALQRGVVEEQEELVDLALQREPQHFEARLLRGWLHGSTGDYMEMGRSANDVIALRENDADGFFLRGAALYLLDLDSDSRSQSLVDLDHAVQLGGDSPWLFTLRAMANEGLGLGDRALADLDRALEGDPDHVTALLTRGRIQRRNGNAQAAISDMSHILRVDAVHADAYILRGEAYEDLKLYALAKADYEQAVNIQGATPSLLMKVFMATANMQRQDAERKRENTNTNAASNDAKTAYPGVLRERQDHLPLPWDRVGRPPSSERTDERR